MDIMRKQSEVYTGKEEFLADILSAAEIVIPEDGIEEKLELAEKENRRLRVKMGFDPTSPDLHLGHAVSMIQLRKFQKMGHLPVIIVGDFTGMIGDPTGRDKSRPVIPIEQLQENAKTYITQLGKILDTDDIEIRPNSEWFSNMTASDVIALLREGSLAATISRNDFRARLDEGSPIGLHEVVYPLIMGYDSVAVEADVELGGVDQLYGFQAARLLQANRKMPVQTSVMMPLLTGLDGVKKMSKSQGNHVGLLDPPRDMFGKLMSIPDTLIEEYLHLASTFTPAETAKLVQEIADGRNPMDVKMDMAKNITTLYHDEEKATEAEEHFRNQFSVKGASTEFRPIEIKATNSPIELLRLLGLADSNQKARTLITQGALRINGVQITDWEQPLKDLNGAEIKVGKRNFYRVSFSET